MYMLYQLAIMRLGILINNNSICWDFRRAATTSSIHRPTLWSSKQRLLVGRLVMVANNIGGDISDWEIQCLAASRWGVVYLFVRAEPHLLRRVAVIVLPNFSPHPGIKLNTDWLMKRASITTSGVNLKAKSLSRTGSDSQSCSVTRGFFASPVVDWAIPSFESYS